MLRNLLWTFILLLTLIPCLSAETFDFMKLCDEVSFYANTSDKFDTRGRTLQVVALNQVKIGAWFQVEFTGDFNWDLTPGYDYDYYIEVGVVKSVWKNLSVNYQRIYGTFVEEPVNQFGIRLAL
jgi:hypothetical protein